MTVPWRGGRGCCSAYLVQICEVFYRSDHSSALHYPSNFLLYISLSSKLSQLGHNIPPETSVFEMTSYLALFLAACYNYTCNPPSSQPSSHQLCEQRSSCSRCTPSTSRKRRVSFPSSMKPVLEVAVVITKPFSYVVDVIAMKTLDLRPACQNSG